MCGSAQLPHAEPWKGLGALPAYFKYFMYHADWEYVEVSDKCSMDQVRNWNSSPGDLHRDTIYSRSRGKQWFNYNQRGSTDRLG